ncbi:hypothetical protein KY290_010899 [Solanum tuberosum]|uniref:Uncharacterized protein n=1 Tax=Solanum tuberosum TaxID=4113 RepID=A0ABQ7W1P5_SOLTU|nr:hypothetical protein KY290_010899 [Solanum tuberosum]
MLFTLQMFSLERVLESWFPSFRCLAASQGEDAIKATLEPVFDSLVLLEDAFKNCNKGKKFFGGDKIGYMDIALGCFLRLMRVTEKMNNVTLLNDSSSAKDVILEF